MTRSEVRLTVIQRWKALEQQTTLSGALILAARQAEQIEAQQVLIASHLTHYHNKVMMFLMAGMLAGIGAIFMKLFFPH